MKEKKSFVLEQAAKETTRGEGSDRPRHSTQRQSCHSQSGSSYSSESDVLVMTDVDFSAEMSSNIFSSL